MVLAPSSGHFIYKASYWLKFNLRENVIWSLQINLHKKTEQKTFLQQIQILTPFESAENTEIDDKIGFFEITGKLRSAINVYKTLIVICIFLIVIPYITFSTDNDAVSNSRNFFQFLVHHIQGFWKSESANLIHDVVSYVCALCYYAADLPCKNCFYIFKHHYRVLYGYVLFNTIHASKYFADKMSIIHVLT